MDPSFGARLRQQRELQQIALADIAEQTKIKVSLLDALERDDLSHWPKGIFRKSYLRSYAQAIGLDPDVTLREFLELYPDQTGEDIPSALADARLGAEGRRPPTRLRFLIDSAISAIPAIRESVRNVVAANPLAVSRDEAPAAPRDPFRATRVPVEVEPELAAVIAAEGTAADLAGPYEDSPPPRTYEEPDGGSLAMVFAEEELVTRREEVLRRYDVPAPVAPTPPVIVSHPVEDVDVGALAYLCTRLARAQELDEVRRVFADSAQVLDAAGLILWMLDARAGVLAPALAHGYSADVLSRLPRIGLDTDTAIGVAFSTQQPRVVNGGLSETGAIAVPLVTPYGCAGVLAVEVRDGAEQRCTLRAAATILAAQLATVFGSPAQAQLSA